MQKLQKEKKLSTFLTYFLTGVSSIINLFVDFIVDKLIDFQKFESKSYQNNLVIIITVITLVFTGIISTILINTKFQNKYISFFIFGQYEDITPQWVNEVLKTIYMGEIYSNLIITIIRFSLFNFRCIEKLEILLLKNTVISFFDYFELLYPEFDYKHYYSRNFFYLFFIGFMFFMPDVSAIGSAGLICETFIIFTIFERKNKHRNELFINKQLFRICFNILFIFLIIRICIMFWWFSSEYFFIDIMEDPYGQFFGSNKKLIDKFIKGNANISEKIIVKLLLKRNILFFIFLFLIIIYVIIINIRSNKDKNNNRKINNNADIFDENDFTQFKKSESNILLYTKFIGLNLHNCKSTKELKHFLELKINQNSNYEALISLKNQVITRNDVRFINPDFTYSPLLLEDYSNSIISKLILSPYSS